LFSPLFVRESDSAQKTIDVHNENLRRIQVALDEAFSKPTNKAGGASSSSSVKSSHASLIGRELANQHPISSIVGLSEAIESKKVYHGVYWHPQTGYEASWVVAGTVGAPTFSLSADTTIWVRGVKHIISAGLILAGNNSTGLPEQVYVYHDGVSLVASTVAWNLQLVTPLLSVYFSKVGGYRNGFYPQDERHHFDRNPAEHERAHWSTGTFCKPAPPVYSGYTLSSQSAGACSLAIASTTVCDEEITQPTVSYSTGDLKQVGYVTTVANQIMSPSLADGISIGATYLQRQVSLAGGGLQEVTGVIGLGTYINYWHIVGTGDVVPYLLACPGCTEFASLSDAQAVDIATDCPVWNVLNSREFVPVARLTYRVRSTYTSAGKCTLEAVSRLSSSRQSVINNIGLGTIYASGVVFTPVGTLASTNVQSAIGELEGNVVHKTGGETIAGEKTFTDYIRAYNVRGIGASALTVYGAISGTPAFNVTASGNIEVTASVKFSTNEVYDIGDSDTLRPFYVRAKWFKGNQIAIDGAASALEFTTTGGVALSTRAPNNHASSATTYGVGSDTNYGHLKLYTSTGVSTDGTMDRNSITNALAGKANTAHTNSVGASIGIATSTLFGHVVLYTSTGSNTDGPMDRNSTTAALNLKANAANAVHTGTFTINGTGTVVSTADANATIASTCTNWITRATYTANRIVTLPTPAVGKELRVGCANLDTTYSVNVTPASGHTWAWGGSAAVALSSAPAGRHGLVLVGISATQWAVMGGMTGI
jgi:hypothetical protein